MNYRLNDKLLMQDVADEMVLLNPDTGVYFTLDAVGARMLQLLRELNDAAAVADAITAEYEVEKEHALQDLQGLLRRMSEHGLAEPVDEQAE